MIWEENACLTAFLLGIDGLRPADAGCPNVLRCIGKTDGAAVSVLKRLCRAVLFIHLYISALWGADE